MEGREEIGANRIAFEIRAWFLRPIADTRVARIAKRQAESTDPGEIRAWLWG